MHREQAERLLAALIFDDLDETSKTELLAYLETDDELRDRLADMRMAVKVTSDSVKQGPEPVLGQERVKRLASLARGTRARLRIFTVQRLAAAAAIVVALVGLLIPHLGRSQRVTAFRAAVPTIATPPPAQPRPAGEDEALGLPGLAGSEGKRSAGVGEGGGRYAVSSGVGRDRVYTYGGLDRKVRDRREEVSEIQAQPARADLAMKLRDSVQLKVEDKAGKPYDSLSESQDWAREVLRGQGQAISQESREKYGELGLQKAEVPAPGSPPVNNEKAKVPAVAATSLEVTSAATPVQASTELRARRVTNSPERAPEGKATTGALPAEPRQAESNSQGRIEIDSVSRLTSQAGGSSVGGSLQPGQKVAKDRSGALADEDASTLPAASRFRLVPVNPWVLTERDRLSTFGLDVDTASYALCRRYIRGGFLPPTGAVRMEEFVNAFDYDYPQRADPCFQVHAEAAPSPFAGPGEGLTLLRIGVKARTIGRDQLRPAHLVFVVDASASMGQADRLPLVQQALGLLIERLSPADRISLVSYANEASLHLEATPAHDRDKIRQAIDAIQPAGPTNLLAGLKLGYAVARQAFVAGQVNHVVLCSDGVANVGQTEAEGILDEVAADRRQGITITCVGVGYGAYNDALLEALADRGDGSYVFLDSPQQAQRVLVERLAATLQTVAKDARIQVDFNPQQVRRYRLIGYENRDIEDRRFRDDTVEAGAVGSGQCATALYELELIGQPSADPQQDLGTVFVRFRNAETGAMEEISSRLTRAIVHKPTVEDDPRFFLAAGAARFAEWLRQSEHAQHTDFADVLRVLDQVRAALPLDGDVSELADLVRRAEHLPRAP